MQRKRFGTPESKPDLRRNTVPGGDCTAGFRPKHLVLVVEDHPDTRTAVVEHLEEHGFEVAIASDGEAALRAIREKQPDLVYLDMNLPRISGYDVCEQIRTDPLLREVGVIMTSAQCSLHVHVACLEAGADAFIPKPFELDALADAMDRIVSTRAAPPSSAPPSR